MAKEERDICFSWFAPTHGDARYIGGRDASLSFTPDRIAEIAIAAERVGFERILLPAGPSCADTFVIATMISSVTSSLVPIVAIRPGSIMPTIAAKMAATLDQVSKGRVALNIVAGGSPAELGMDGDFLSHDDRYSRAGEYISILKNCWSGEAFDFDGKYYRIRGAAFHPGVVQRPHPTVYMAGMSDAGMSIAAQKADVYLMWGEPVSSVRKQIEAMKRKAIQSERSVSFGLRINLIVASRKREAWERAEAMIASVDPNVAERARAYLANSDSVGQKRIQATVDCETEDPCYWTGMVPFRSGNSTALVGDYAAVSESVKKYIAAGITEFIFSSYPHCETVSDVGEMLLPLCV